MIAQQLQAARAAHWRQNENPILTLDDAQTWLSQHPLCLYLPRHAQLPAPAPSFVEACLGQRTSTPSLAAIEPAQALLVRLIASGDVVPLNLFGVVGEQPDFLAHRDALPSVLSLRADPDWKHAPQKSSGHKVSPLVLELWKVMEKEGTVTADQARDILGRELTEAAVLRALSELWQALRVSPVYAEPGQAARWEMMRVHHRDALAAAGSTGQVTAISLLVSMYLQSVYSATGEEIEVFLSPVTSRSRVREAVRGLSATRQIQSLSMDAQTYYFLENGLPEFAELAVTTSFVIPPQAAPAGDALAQPLPPARPAARKRQATSPAVPAPAAPLPPSQTPIFRRPKPVIPVEIDADPRPAARPARATPFGRPERSASRPSARPGSRPAFGSGARTDRPSARSGDRSNARPAASFGARPTGPRSAARPSAGGERSASARPTGARPAAGAGWKSQGRPATPGRFPARPPRPQTDRPATAGARPAGKEGFSSGARPPFRPARPFAGNTRGASDAGTPARPASAPRDGERPSARPYARPGGARPDARGPARPYTRSSAGPGGQRPGGSISGSPRSGSPRSSSPRPSSAGSGGSRPGAPARSAPKPWALPGRKSASGPPRPPRAGARSGDAAFRPAPKRFDRPAGGAEGASRAGTGRPPARPGGSARPYVANRAPATGARTYGARPDARPSPGRGAPAGAKPASHTGTGAGSTRPRTGPPRGDRPEGTRPPRSGPGGPPRAREGSARPPRPGGSGAGFARPRPAGGFGSSGAKAGGAAGTGARTGIKNRPPFQPGSRPARPGSDTRGTGSRPGARGAGKPWAGKGAASGKPGRPPGSNRPDRTKPGA